MDDAAARRALGEALARRVREPVAAVSDELDRRGEDAGATDEFRERRDATVLLGTMLIARWLITGEGATPEEARWVGLQGEVAAEAGVAVAIRTRGYLLWRDATSRILREEGERLDLPHAVVLEAVGMVRRSCDASLLWMAEAYDRKQEELREQLVHLSLHDPLTGLANRRLFDDRLQQAVKAAIRHRRRLAVLVLDLDGFKSINDAHGHAAGDAVLQQLAGRFQACLRASDTVGRLGGDEFGFLLDGIAGEAEARTVASKLLGAAREPVPLPGGEVGTGASVGVALYPDHGIQAPRLLNAADAAMYEAKRARAGCAVAFLA